MSTTSNQQVWAGIREAHEQHVVEWHVELLGVMTPDWTYLLGLHLRLVELEALLRGVDDLL